jgi:3-dehydroquinate dehydratase/shikimate dehydrogenase
VNKGKICVSVCAETVDGIIDKIRQAEDLADVIEVRFDCLSKQEFDVNDMARSGLVRSRILDATDKPLISTFRPRSQGGCGDLTLQEQARFWGSGFETDYCDVEEKFVQATLPPRSWGERICSFHDHSGVPENIEELFGRLARTGAEIVKIAVHANEIVDAMPVWKLLEFSNIHKQNTQPRVIPIAMGDSGQWTRILGLAHGAYLTYVSVDEGDETAAGQISARDMIELYRAKELSRDTKVYGVIGDPVSSSLSPYVHNSAFAAADVDAVFLPLLVRDLHAFFNRMVLPATREVELNFAGFAVTMPHKQTVMKYLDWIDPAAERIGAVNTIKMENGKLLGSNTDADGFIRTLKARAPDLSGARFAMIGSGGAARACIDALRQEPVDVTLFGRDAAKAARLADEFSITADTISNLRSSIPDFDIVVNATPLGMQGDLANVSPLTADQLKGVKLVFDLVTRAGDTPLMREAKEAGVDIISGVEMLLEQAAEQFQIWTGIEAPRSIMRKSAFARMGKMG